MIDLALIRENFIVIAKKYGLSVDEVEYFFYKSISQYYHTDEIEYKSKGVTINGKYKNISSKDMIKIKENFTDSLISTYKKNIKTYCERLIKFNKNILHCKIIKETNNYYHLQPYSAKDQPIKYFIVEVEKSSIIFPDVFNIIPIYIIPSSMTVYNKNMYKVKGRIISHETFRYHLDKLEAKFLKKLNNPIKLNTVMLDISIHTAKISSPSKLSKFHIKNIKEYFKLFNLNIKLENILKKNIS